MAYSRVLTSALAGTATIIWIAWMLLTGGAQTEAARAYDTTTEQSAARAGAQIIPSAPPSTVEPAGYR